MAPFLPHCLSFFLGVRAAEDLRELCLDMEPAERFGESSLELRSAEGFPFDMKSAEPFDLESAAVFRVFRFFTLEY